MTQKLGPSTYTTQLCNPYCRLVMQLVERLAEGKGGGNPIRYIQFGFIFEKLLNGTKKQKYPLGNSNRLAYESLRQKEVLSYSFFFLYSIGYFRDIYAS